MSTQKLTGQEINDQVAAGWVYVAAELQTRITTPDFVTGLSIVNAIGSAAEEANHHPDIDLRYSHVDIRLSSHDVRGITDRDISLAQAISTIATDAGLETDGAHTSRIEMALDSPAFGTVLPFWGAVLAMESQKDAGFDDELRDPFGAMPTLWFQSSGSEDGRQRWHPDVWVDPAEVQPRIDAAIAAGGTLESDQYAPSFWILADPEGNKVCLCTWQERG